MPHIRAPRFVAYVASVFVILVAVQLVASIFFYQAIDRQTLRDDHARRIAELLVVSDRVYAASPRQLPEIMNSRYLRVTTSSAPAVQPNPMSPDLQAISQKIISWEPSLDERSLRLSRVPGQQKSEDLVGSIRLPGGQWLNFRSIDITTMWSVVWRATVITLASALTLLVIGLFSLMLLARPLRRLATAADLIGHGRDITISEDGPRDIRELAHAMNVMQSRIARLLRDQAKSFEAISHDLRTPLARQKVASDFVKDPEISELLLGNVNEMEALLSSLSQFLRAQRLESEPETVDLIGVVQSVARTFGSAVTVTVSAVPEVLTYREPLTLALEALIENAAHYGTTAIVTVEADPGGGWAVIIQDNGPGIPAEYFEDILDPFFRLDEARARDTRGFGLGIPTAHRLMARFNGSLTFATSDRGGLIVRLKVPQPLEY